MFKSNLVTKGSSQKSEKISLGICGRNDNIAPTKHRISTGGKADLFGTLADA